MRYPKQSTGKYALHRDRCFLLNYFGFVYLYYISKLNYRKYLHYFLIISAVDIWAAGVIFLCLLSRRYPFFKAKDDMEALSQIVVLFGSRKIRKMAESIGIIQFIFYHDKFTISDILILDLRS